MRMNRSYLVIFLAACFIGLSSNVVAQALNEADLKDLTPSDAEEIVSSAFTGLPTSSIDCSEACVACKLICLACVNPLNWFRPECLSTSVWCINPLNGPLFPCPDVSSSPIKGMFR